MFITHGSYRISVFTFLLTVYFLRMHYMFCHVCMCSIYVFFLISCLAVPQQQSLTGPSQQTVSKQETETKIDVVKPSDSDEGNSQASEDSTKTCSAKGSEQQKESEAVSVS